jgi:hypothetical protein
MARIGNRRVQGVARELAGVDALRKAGKNPRPEPGRGKILLRVFFHAHGNKLILLLSGYDKGERPARSTRAPRSNRRAIPQTMERTGESSLTAMGIGAAVAI